MHWWLNPYQRNHLFPGECHVAVRSRNQHAKYSEIQHHRHTPHANLENVLLQWCLALCFVVQCACVATLLQAPRAFLMVKALYKLVMCRSPPLQEMCPDPDAASLQVSHQTRRCRTLPLYFSAFQKPGEQTAYNTTGEFWIVYFTSADEVLWYFIFWHHLVQICSFFFAIARLQQCVTFSHIFGTSCRDLWKVNVSPACVSLPILSFCALTLWSEKVLLKSTSVYLFNHDLKDLTWAVQLSHLICYYELECWWCQLVCECILPTQTLDTANYFLPFPGIAGNDIYWEILRLRKQMVLAKLGLSWSVPHVLQFLHSNRCEAKLQTWVPCTHKLLHARSGSSCVCSYDIWVLNHVAFMGAATVKWVGGFIMTWSCLKVHMLWQHSHYMSSGRGLSMMLGEMIGWYSGR